MDVRKHTDETSILMRTRVGVIYQGFGGLEGARPIGTNSAGKMYLTIYKKVYKRYQVGVTILRQQIGIVPQKECNR